MVLECIVTEEGIKPREPFTLLGREFVNLYLDQIRQVDLEHHSNFSIPKSGEIVSFGVKYRFEDPKKLKLYYPINKPWCWDCKDISPNPNRRYFVFEPTPKFESTITQKNSWLNHTTIVLNYKEVIHPHVHSNGRVDCGLNKPEYGNIKGRYLESLISIYQAVLMGGDQVAGTSERVVVTARRLPLNGPNWRSKKPEGMACFKAPRGVR